jgi:hypothetical protein
MLKAAVGYVRNNPDEVVRAAVNVTALRVGVPLAGLRWLAGQVKGSKAPTDVEIASVPQGLRLSAVVDALGTPVRASAAVKVEEVRVEEHSLRVGVRVRDVTLAVAGESESPVAALIKSGALDLSKPGTLLKFIPSRPPAIVEADGDRVVVDLLKLPKLAKDSPVRRAIGVLAPVLGVAGIETDRDHLYVRFSATPQGLPKTVQKLRGLRKQRP